MTARGLHTRQGLLFVVDGAKATAAAVARVFIAGYSHLPVLAEALEVYASRFDEAAARAS